MAETNVSKPIKDNGGTDLRTLLLDIVKPDDLKELLISIINERGRTADQRFEKIEQLLNEREQKQGQKFAGIDRAIDTLSKDLKDGLLGVSSSTEKALATVYSQNKDALANANTAIVTAGTSVDKRFEAATQAVAEATRKAETATARDISAAVDGGKQSSALQGVRIDALDAKVNLLFAQANRSEGKENGQAIVWGAVAVIVTILLTGTGIAVALLTRAH